MLRAWRSPCVEDDGSLRAYVQEVQENEIFRVGERVRIMSVNGTSHVAH